MTTTAQLQLRKRKKGALLPMVLRHTSFMTGAVIVLALLVIAAFPQWFTDQDPAKLDGSMMLKAPSAEHWFGTDNYGRDIYSRVIYATRFDLALGFFGAVVPFFFGSVLGLICGYYGGWFDNLIMRILDVMMAFPFTVLVIAIMAILGTGVFNIFIAMWVTGWLTFCRLTRAETLVLKNSEFVQSAVVSGFSDARILLRHLLPNAISPAIVYFASEIVMCLLTGAGMSFLGLGVPPDQPEWGNILQVGRGFMTVAWWMTVLPGIFLSVAGIAFSLIGDGLADFLRTKGR